jgi:hypothetical protein
MPKTQTKRGLSPRELDALRKQFIAEQKQADSASKWQLANDIVSGINDIVGRGVIAPILGMPGDINQAIYDAGAWVNNKIKDVEVATGMVKQPRYVQASQGNAYLGSEDIGNRMQQAGLVSSERRPMTELAASFVSPSAVAKTAINAPKTAMNMLRMAENLEAPSRGVRNAQGMYIPRGQMGAIENLWHGSPHTFDRFDLSKIGTGEGAQAYGHGAYLAEGKGVAEWYQSQLGKYYDQISTPEGMMPLEAGLAKYHPDGAVMAKVANNFRKNLDVDSFNALVDDLYLPEIRATIPENEWGNFSAQSGNLYQTRLAWPDAARETADPLSPENFLDLDKPLIEQSPMVQEAIGRFEGAVGINESKIQRPYQVTGSSLYDSYFLSTGADPARLAKELNKAGIPGIRYLDAGSRGAGKGSRNYVVFDDKLIDIVSRNNQPIRKAEAPQAKVGIVWDRSKGIGNVPNQQELDYFGFERNMKPSEFRQYVPKGVWNKDTKSFLASETSKGKTVAPPFLKVEWDKENKAWRVSNHEGRSRADYSAELNADADIPVSMLPVGMRARDITPEMRSAPIIGQQDSPSYTEWSSKNKGKKK